MFEQYLQTGKKLLISNAKQPMENHGDQLPVRSPIKLKANSSKEH